MRIFKKFRNWWYWHSWEAVIVSIIVVLFVGIGYGSYLQEVEKQRKYKQFMFECTKDKKEYECEAMWRAGEPKVEHIYIPMK